MNGPNLLQSCKKKTPLPYVLGHATTKLKKELTWNISRILWFLLVSFRFFIMVIMAIFLLINNTTGSTAGWGPLSTHTASYQLCDINFYTIYG